MKLSEEQIKQLYAFVEKKSVRWYDLQTELVDHLASQIEELWKTNPALSFDESLAIVYKQFGIFGFSKIVQQKEAEVNRHGRRLYLHECKAAFSWPNILKTASILLALYTLTIWIPATYILYAASAINIFYCVLFIRKIIQLKHTKLLMLQSANYFQTFFWGLYVLYFPNLLEIKSTKLIIFYAFLTILNVLIVQKIVNEMIIKCKKLYPAAFAN